MFGFMAKVSWHHLVIEYILPVIFFYEYKSVKFNLLHYISFSFLIPGKYGQESEFDISVLSPTEAYSALLLVHPVLHHSTIDNVPARSSVTSLGCLLCPWDYVCLEYPSSTAIIPVHSPVPSI